MRESTKVAMINKANGWAASGAGGEAVIGEDRLITVKLRMRRPLWVRLWTMGSGRDLWCWCWCTWWLMRTSRRRGRDKRPRDSICGRGDGCVRRRRRRGSKLDGWPVEREDQSSTRVQPGPPSSLHPVSITIVPPIDDQQGSAQGASFDPRKSRCQARQCHVEMPSWPTDRPARSARPEPSMQLQSQCHPFTTAKRLHGREHELLTVQCRGRLAATKALNRASVYKAIVNGVFLSLLFSDTRVPSCSTRTPDIFHPHRTLNTVGSALRPRSEFPA